MSTSPQHDESTDWTVLINEEEQYSLWREPRPVPAGWRQVFGPAAETACVEYVEQHWTDMRPRSARRTVSNNG